MMRSEKPCGVYRHPHENQNCRCFKLCINCGHTKIEHMPNEESEPIAVLRNKINELNKKYEESLKLRNEAGRQAHIHQVSMDAAKEKMSELQRAIERLEENGA